MADTKASKKQKLSELEARFVAHTNYHFEWKDCVTLQSDYDAKGVKEDNVTLEEAVRLIEEDGYVPIPF